MPSPSITATNQEVVPFHLEHQIRCQRELMGGFLHGNVRRVEHSSLSLLFCVENTSKHVYIYKELQQKNTFTCTHKEI